MNRETKGGAPNTWRKNHGLPNRSGLEKIGSPHAATQPARPTAKSPTPSRIARSNSRVPRRCLRRRNPTLGEKKFGSRGAVARVTRWRRPNSRVSQRCLRRRIPALRKISLPVVGKYVSPPHRAVMRSYQGYYTRSHQNSEVKRLWAGIVLGWVTSREVPVLHPFSKNLEDIFPLNCFPEKDPTTKENKLQKRIRGTNSRQGRNPM